MHSCHYCRTFKNTNGKLRRMEQRDGRKYHYRFCEETEKEVLSDSKVCEHFRPADYFWCKKDNNWMHILSCLNRSYKCEQKEDVLDAIRGFDIRKEFGMKPVLVKRESNKVKPVLIRRVK